ncbi:MAG: DUF4349 domain-containing protein, partial [Myxococcota bacterium]
MWSMLWLFWSVALAQAEAQEATAINATMVLKVQRPTEVADRLVERAASDGGYFAERSLQQVRFKIPTQKAEAFIDYAEAQGVIASRSFNNVGLTTQLAEVRARLAAREAVLERYFDVLKTASPQSVITVERQIVGLVAEIEGLKGRIRAMEHRATFADIQIDFRFRDRAAPVRDGSSSFSWLNTMNLTDIMEAFHNGYNSRASKRYNGAPVPDGFAPYRWPRREDRAVSPDDIVFRVRAEKHKPKADLGFWEEALLERMAAAGYQPAGDPKRLTVDGVQGTMVEFNAPLGTDDYTYLVALFPNGRKLIIA